MPVVTKTITQSWQKDILSDTYFFIGREDSSTANVFFLTRIITTANGKYFVALYVNARQ